MASWLEDLLDFANKPLFPHPANAFAPAPGSQPAPLLPAPAPAAPPQPWYETTPLATHSAGWAYAASTIHDIYNPPTAPDQPAPAPGPLEHFMAFATGVGAVSETTYNTPLPGGLTGAEAMNTNANLQLYHSTQQAATPFILWDALTGGNAGQRTFERAATGGQNLYQFQQENVEAWRADVAAIQRNADPATWHMTPAQAAEFSMARRAAMGWEQPAFTDLLLPNPNRGQAMTEPQALAAQARWITQREADTQQIMDQANAFAAISQGAIDPGPTTDAMLRALGIPTPGEVYAQQAVWQGQQALGAGHTLAGAGGVTGPTIPGAVTSLGATGTTGFSAPTVGATTAAVTPMAFDAKLGYLDLPAATAAAVTAWGIPTQTLTQLADPDAYAKLYGTPEFYALLSTARLADAQQRQMPINQLQDRSIPLLNQMAYDITFGADTLLGGLPELLGLGGYAMRAGKALNLIENAPVGTAATAARMTEGMAGNVPWRFSDDFVQSLAVTGRNVRNFGQSGFAAAAAGLGALGMYQLSQTDENDQNRMVGGIAAPVMGAMALLGLPGAVRAATDFIPDSLLHAAQPNPQLGAELNRTLNNIRSLWTFRDNPDAPTYRPFLEQTAAIWQQLQTDPRPRTFLDIETTLEGGDIFQISAKRAGGRGELMTWLIRPPEGSDLGASTEGQWSAHTAALQEARASGRSLAEVMPEVQAFLQGSIIVGQNAADFDMTRLQRAGLDTSQLPIIDTYAMALLANVKGPDGSQRLADLYQQATGSPLVGAHEAGADVMATETVYNWLLPQIQPSLEREYARVANQPAVTSSLADLNRRQLPTSLGQLMGSLTGTYRTDEQMTALLGAFPNQSQEQILEQIRRGNFANIEQYQAVYGRTSGAADLDAIVNREREFFAGVGATEQGALGFYDFRAEEQIKNRIRGFAPQFNTEQVNNAYTYLRSQYPGYDPSYLNAVLPSIGAPDNKVFWTQVVANANFTPNLTTPPVVSPRPRPMSGGDFLTDLIGHMGLQTMPMTPENLTDLLFAASGVTERAVSLKQADASDQTRFMTWAMQNPELHLGPHAISEAAVMALPDIPLNQQPAFVSDMLGLGTTTDLLNEDAYQRAVANNPNLTREQFMPYANYSQAMRAESAAVYQNRGGTIGLPGQRELVLPGQTATNAYTRSLYQSLVYDYSANLFGGRASALDALGTALEQPAQLSPSAAWAYQQAQELLATQGDSAQSMFHMRVDPNDPDQLGKLLALNELAPSTGMHLDLRRLRTVAVPGPDNSAFYEFQVPLNADSDYSPSTAYLDSLNHVGMTRSDPSYSYRNRPEDLALATLSVQLGQQAARRGDAQLNLTSAADWQAYQTGDRLHPNRANPYAGYTPEQLTGAVRADTENLITRGLQMMVSGHGDWKLPSEARNLRVSQGATPTTWSELLQAYTENRVISRVGPSAELVRTPLTGTPFDTGAYVRSAAASAGLFVDTSRGFTIDTLDASPNAAIANRYTDPATGRPIAAVYEDYAAQWQTPLQVTDQPGANPFAFDRNNLTPGLQVTTDLQGALATGSIVSRLDDGSYRVAFQRPAVGMPSQEPSTMPFFNVNEEGELLQRGVTFQDSRYGGSSATYYQNLRPEQITDVYAAGADALNLPLMQARRLADQDLIASRAATSVDYAAKDLLYNVLNQYRDPSTPLTITHAERYSPDVLRRADELLEMTRAQPTTAASTQQLGAAIPYYLDWDQAQMTGKQGMVIPLAAGAPEQAGPRGSTAWRSAGFSFDLALNDAANVASVQRIQERQALESLAAAWEAGGAGRYQPYNYTPGAPGSYEAQAMNMATMATDFGVLEQLAYSQGLFVQPTRTSATGGLEYTLRPRRANDPQSLKELAPYITNIQERIGATVDRYLEQIPGWGGEAPRPNVAWTTERDTATPNVIAGKEIYGAVNEWAPTRPRLDYELPPVSANVREGIERSLALGQQLTPQEVQAAQRAGLLEGKVFMRLIPGTVFDAGKGLMVRDQGLRAHDIPLTAPAPGQSQEFTQGWWNKAGWQFYTDPIAAMGMNQPKRDPFSLIELGSNEADYLKGPMTPIDEQEYLRTVAPLDIDLDEEPSASMITYADRNDATTGQRFPATQDPNRPPYDGNQARAYSGRVGIDDPRYTKLNYGDEPEPPPITNYPIAIIDAEYAAAMARQLNLTWPEEDLPATFHVGPNEQNLDKRLLYNLPAGKVSYGGPEVVLTPNSMTVREIQKAESAAWDARRQLAGNFLAEITQPHYQVRDLEGNWIDASGMTTLATGARFDPNNPSATPQYARQAPGSTRWQPAEAGDPGAQLMWTRQPETTYKLGAYVGGHDYSPTTVLVGTQYQELPGWRIDTDTEGRLFYDEIDNNRVYLENESQLPPGALRRGEQGPLPAAAYASPTIAHPTEPWQAIYDQPRFATAIDLKQWYARLQDANTLPVDQRLPDGRMVHPRQEALEMLRKELDTADRFGAWQTQAENLPSNWTGRVPSIADLRTLTYLPAGETLADREVERARNLATNQRMARQLAILDESDFGVETDPAVMERVEQDATAATIQMTLEQGGGADRVDELLQPKGTLAPQPEDLMRGEAPATPYTPPQTRAYTGAPRDFGNNIDQLRRYWTQWWQQQTGGIATRKAWAGAPVGLGMMAAGGDDNEDNQQPNWLQTLGMALTVGAVGIAFRPGMMVDTPIGRGVIEFINDATQEAAIRLDNADPADPAVRGPLDQIRPVQDAAMSPAATAAANATASAANASQPAPRRVLWVPPGREDPINVTLRDSYVNDAGETIYKASVLATPTWLETKYPALDYKNLPEGARIPTREIEIPARELALTDPSAPRRLAFTPDENNQSYADTYAERTAPSELWEEYQPGIGNVAARGQNAIYPQANYFTATRTVGDQTSTVMLGAPISSYRESVGIPGEPRPDGTAGKPRAVRTTYYPYLGEQLLDAEGNVYYGNRNASMLIPEGELSDITAAQAVTPPTGDPFLGAGAAIPGYEPDNFSAVPFSNRPPRGQPAGSYQPAQPIWTPPMPPPTPTQTALAAMGSPGRPPAGAFSYVNPFADTLTTKAVRFREEMDYVGNLFTSATDNPANWATFMRALADDPTALATGIPGNLLADMDSQLDENGLFRFGSGSIANDKLASVMPIIAQSGPVLNAMADDIERISAAEQAQGGAWTANQFARYFNEGMMNIGMQWYGTDQVHPLTKGVRELAYWQRKLLAEINLNLNPAQYTNNFANNRWTGAVEGFSMTTTVEEAARQAQAVFRTFGTARADAGEMGMVGSGAYLGYQGGSIFQAHTWANRLFGIPEHDYAGNIVRYRGGIFSNADNATRAKVHGIASAIDRFTSMGHVAVDEDGNPIIDASGNPVYENVAARASKAGGNIWTTNTTIGGQSFGEGGAYAVLTTEAQQRVFAEQTAQMFGDTFTRMAADPNLNPTIVDELRQYTLANAGKNTRDRLADSYTGIINTAGGNTTDYRQYTSELLGRHDDLRTTALRTGFAVAENAMLESSHQTNLDSWLGNVFAFSYFTTRTAFNWTTRSLRNPQTLGLFANFVTGARIENENTPGEPNRYSQAVRLWPNGPEVPNLIGSLSGLAKTFGQPAAESVLANADTPQEQLLGVAAVMGMRFLPLIEGALGKPASEIIPNAIIPQNALVQSGLTAANVGFLGQGTDNAYRRYQAGRWIASQAAAGAVDPAMALMGQQILYDEQWLGGPQRTYPEAANALVSSAFTAVGQESAYSALANLGTSISVKPPVNPGEVGINAYADTVNTIRQLDPYQGSQAANLVDALQPNYAVNSLYPDQEMPDYAPGERVSEVMQIPYIPRGENPPNWRQPQWDTTVGIRMINDPKDPSKNESPNANQTDNTAIYFLRDPRNQEIFYVGQSVSPSNRIVQHIEEVNELDAFNNPKTLRIAEMLQQGAYPRMEVFNWAPGSTKTTDDTADKQEMLWIGYGEYVLGTVTNRSTLNRADWEKLVTELGLTKTDLDQQFAMMAADTYPRLENVQMAKTPNITEAVYPADNVPRTMLGSDANNWIPNRTDWKWIQDNQSANTPMPGVDWDDNQWGLPGAGTKKRSQLWAAGFTGWSDLATPTTERFERLVEIAGNAQRAQEWVDKANYTIAVQEGYLPLPPPETAPTTPPQPTSSTGAHQTISYQANTTIPLPELATFSTQPQTTTIPLPELATFSVQQPQDEPLSKQDALYQAYDRGRALTKEQMMDLIPGFGVSMIGAAAGIAAMTGLSWLPAVAQGAYALAQQPRPQQTQAATITPSNMQTPMRQQTRAPLPPQTSQYWYFPGYRPSAEPGQQFWLPNVPGGQFWVAGNMIASGEDYRDPDYVNNPQFDPGNPQTSLTRMREFYGPEQPVPGQYLRTNGAYMGSGPFTSYDQQRTVRTGPSALGSNPYGLQGAAGMLQTQGAPDPHTQPELYAQWAAATAQPRGEYGIWLDEPLSGAPNYGFQQTGNGLYWQTADRTPISASAPGMVTQVAAGPDGQSVVVQHDFGQTIYNNLSGVGVAPGQMLGAGDLVGVSSASFNFQFRLAGDNAEFTDPTPYLPSTGERGPSGWALTDIPGVSRADAQLLVDMGVRTPEELLTNLSPAAIDQHPVFGAAFTARAGWQIFSAAQALLSSGPNPNPPLTASQAALPPSQRTTGTGAGQPAELPRWRTGGASPALTNRPPSQAGTGTGTTIAPAISAFAAANQLDPTLLQAVLNVEAGGRTHDETTGQAIARLEVHQFRDNSGIDQATFNQHFKVGEGDRWFLDASYRTDPNGEWQNVHASQSSEQAAIALATQLTSRAAAFANVSMGAPQIFGGNAGALGYTDAAAMYDAFTADPQAQYQGMFDYLAATGLTELLRNGDIEGFVRRYNGPANVPNYSAAMRAQQAALAATPGATAAATEEQVGADLRPNIVPGLSERRLANLTTKTTLRTVEDIAGLDAAQDATWLGKQLGASKEIAAQMITAAESWEAPSPSTKLYEVEYLFATGNRSEITGNHLSAEDLRRITASGAIDIAALAGMDPYRLRDQTGLNIAQTRNAVAIANQIMTANKAPVTPRTYATPYSEIAGPARDVGDQTMLTVGMMPDLTEQRLAKLNEADIFTIGQLAQVGQQGTPYSGNWLHDRTNITYEMANRLGANARAWTPITDTTYLNDPRVRKELNLSDADLATLQTQGILTVGAMATTQPRWLDERDLAEDYNLPASFTRSNATKMITGAINLLGQDPTKVTADPTRSDPRYEFRDRGKEGGIPGITRERQEWLYKTPINAGAAASSTPNTIDQAEEFIDADPTWLYERSEFRWSLENITAAQNALRVQMGQKPISIQDNPWSNAPGQDLLHLNITAAQIGDLEKADIGIKRNSFTSFLAADNKAIAKALNIPVDQVDALKAKASSQLRAIQAKQQAAPAAPTTPATPPGPTPPTGPTTPIAPTQSAMLAPYAEFLGVTPQELEGLTPEQIEGKVNDKMSLYEQKQMGSGTQDRYAESFRQQVAQLNQPLQQTAQRINQSDRRGMNTTEPNRGPNLNRLVQSTVAGMEDKLAARIFKQLQRSLLG